MRILDLFCGAGGCAKGYQQAGFYVVGVDLEPQPRYVGEEFYIGDAIEVLEALLNGGWKTTPWRYQQGVRVLTLDEFDVIHTSPPCQHYSTMTKSNGRPSDHPNLVPKTRRLLQATGKPYVVENVVGAPLASPLMLCGQMFPGLRVIRHRLFESNVWLTHPPQRLPHPAHPLAHTLDKRKPHYGKLDQFKAVVMVNGGGNSSTTAARDAMGIDWMRKEELNQAIPPAYCEFVGQQLIRSGTL